MTTKNWIAAAGVVLVLISYLTSHALVPGIILIGVAVAIPDK